MDVEIAAIEKNNTWELTDLPKSQMSIGVKWIYKPNSMNLVKLISTKRAWL